MLAFKCWYWNANTYIRTEKFTLGGCTGLQMQIYRRIYNNIKYFTLGGCVALKWPIYRTSYNNSFSQNISLWQGVLVLTGQYTQETAITKNISLWEGVLVLKCKYTEVTIKKNFTLGGFCGVPHKFHKNNTKCVILLVKPRHRTSLLACGTNQILFWVSLKERNFYKREFF